MGCRYTPVPQENENDRAESSSVVRAMRASKCGILTFNSLQLHIITNIQVIFTIYI